MPDQVSGPNTSAHLIANSFLSDNYQFDFIVQEQHAKGRVSLKLIFDLRRQIKTHKPDVIHISGLQSAAFHAVLAAKLSGCTNILLVIRGSSTDALSVPALKRLAFRWVIEPITMRWSRYIYTVCQAMAKREYIKRHCGPRLLGAIHNAAPNQVDLPVKQRTHDSLRATLNVLPNSLIVGIVGRIVEDKGVFYIAEAIKQLTGRPFTFLFVGSGSAEQQLKNLLSQENNEGKVHFLGKRTNVLDIMSDFDIFLFATLHENLSNALLEALAIGLPIIATRVGGNPEVITHNKNGILIEPRNSTQIKSALVQLEGNGELRKKLGSAAKQTALSKFNQQSLLNQLGQIYEQMTT